MLYATKDGETKPVKRLHEGRGKPMVWWCPWCDRSNQEQFTVCQGCGATITPIFPGTTDRENPYLSDELKRKILQVLTAATEEWTKDTFPDSPPTATPPPGSDVTLFSGQTVGIAPESLTIDAAIEAQSGNPEEPIVMVGSEVVVPAPTSTPTPAPVTPPVAREAKGRNERTKAKPFRGGRRG